jgi:hypothetical protein
VDYGTTLEERFPKSETYRIMTPDECMDFVRTMHDHKKVKEAIERRLTNARTLVLMAACAYIPTDGIETTRQGFLSLEKAVQEYRAAVRQDERSRKVKVT